MEIEKMGVFESGKAAEHIFNIFMMCCGMALLVRIIWEFFQTPKKEINQLKKNLDSINTELNRIARRMEAAKQASEVRIEMIQKILDEGNERIKDGDNLLRQLQTDIATLIERSKKKPPGPSS